MASQFSPPSLSSSWLNLLWPFVGPSGEWVFSCVRSVVVKQSADELRRNSTVNNLHFSHLSLFFNNVAVMLRWGRRYRHVSDALVVLSMIMNGTWSASRSACCKPSSAWSCFLFSWLPDYAVCLWITSMLVITVTLRISCHLRGRRHLEFAGIKNCVRFLDCRGSRRNFRRNRWILQTYKPSCRIPST